MQRRRHERFSTDIPCRLFIPAGGGAVKGGAVKFEAFARLRDLSLGGAFVQSAIRFKAAPAELFVELQLPDGAMPVRGTVVRQPDGGLGIAFTSLAQEARARLLRHFVPAQHRRFYDAVLQPMMPELGVDKVSLLLHTWEDWRAADEAAASAPAAALRLGAARRPGAAA
jgi:hypothetical protein